MSAPDLRAKTIDRQRELAARHDELQSLGPEPLDHPDQLQRVFDATSDVLEVLDEVEVRQAQQGQIAALVLLGVVLVLAVLVVVEVLPEYALIAAVLLLAATIGLWIRTRTGAGG